MALQVIDDANPLTNIIKSESHRVYWQQWVTNSNQNNTSSSSQESHSQRNRRDLITSSAAIRISEAASAQDVTRLLRETIFPDANVTTTETVTVSSFSTSSSDHPMVFSDSLVLVGTLYSIPPNYIRFEHGSSHRRLNHGEITTSVVAGGGGIGGSSVLHVVKTLSPGDSPLQVWQNMLDDLTQREKSIQHYRNQNPSSSSSSSTTTVISPKLQWFYVPDHVPPSSLLLSSDNTTTTSPSHKMISIIPSYIDLEGYCTSMEQDDDDDETTNNCTQEFSGTTSHEVINPTNDFCHDDDDKSCCDDDDDDDDEQIYMLPLQHFANKNNCCNADTESPKTTKHENRSINNMADIVVDDDHRDDDDDLISDRRRRRRQREMERAKRRRRRWQRQQHRSAQISQYHHQNPHVKAGFLLLRAQRDLQVWRQVYCILTEDALWYVSRIYYFHDDNNDIGDDDNNLIGSKVESHFATIHGGRNTNSHFGTNITSASFSLHGRISLSSALLLEQHSTGTSSNQNDMTNAARLPFSFEIVQADGTSHMFRAYNRSIQHGWVQALSRIMSSCHENCLFQHAQVIVDDETKARYQRMAQVAVHPVWQKMMKATTTNSTTTVVSSTTSIESSSSCRHHHQPHQHLVRILPHGQVMNVMRLGLQVATYRELCRHVKQHLKEVQQDIPIVPQQQQQLLSTPPQTNSIITKPLLQHTRPSPKQSSPIRQPPLDTQVKMVVDTNIRATWDTATILLARATQVVSEFQGNETTICHRQRLPDVPSAVVTHQDSPTITTTTSRDSNNNGVELSPPPPMPPKRALSRSFLDTQCRHIDYIITGRLRPLSSSVGSSSSNSHGDQSTSSYLQPRVAVTNHHQKDPAPADLFDSLLSELQLLAITADFRLLQQQQDEELTMTSDGVKNM